MLVASVPPQGVLRTAVRVWLHHPWIALRANTVGNSVDLVNTPPLAREHLFSARTPEPIVESCTAGVQPESLRAAFVDALFRLPKPRRVNTPLLILGAEDDGFISNHRVRATARTYRTQAELFPGMGHNMMLEPGWAHVAERIHAWLCAQGL